jgi:EAL domain-containing protein (putative c-di-GMP-specific phosphodiesterase class I)
MTAAVESRSEVTVAQKLTGHWFLEGCLDEQSIATCFRIGKSPYTVGRAAHTDFCLPSRNVSKVHAELILAGDHVLVRDLGSTNGTFVNGRRITAPTPIGEGDLLQFSDMEFRLGHSKTPSGENTAVSRRPEDGWLISRLNEVVNQQRFNMVFQPIVSSDGLHQVAFEALLRCEVTGMESPIDVFKAAERFGLEDRLSQMCRAQAVAAFANRPSNQMLFLNTHPHEHLGAELINSLVDLRRQAGDRTLVLEIHEGAVPDMPTMREFSAELRKIGIKLAYDDFGAGQSRLVELAVAPPDFLKVDRGLLTEIATADTGRRALLQSLISHANGTGIATVAEGLDCEESVRCCREIGFTHFQGYHLGRPAPMHEWR